MVEYAVLLGHNASSFITQTGADLVTWASRLDPTTLGLAALAVVTLRMGVVIFKRR
jgi:hypothetical protein